MEQGVRDIVEPGRICFINYGEDYGKMVVVADIADQNRVLVDGLGTFPRVLMPLQRLTLTKLRIVILRGARTGTIAKVAKAYDLNAKWEKTPAAQKMNRFRLRAATTDLDRFRIMVARKQRSYAVRHLAAAGKSKKPVAAKVAAKKAPAAKGKGKK